MADSHVSAGAADCSELPQWHQRGYLKLAHLMSSHPDYAILRRFGQLNLLNLLNYQAERRELERQYLECCEEDDTSNDLELNLMTSDFHLLHRSERPKDIQKQVLDQIRFKLERYCMQIQ